METAAGPGNGERGEEIDSVRMIKIKREFDPGSESTLAARLTHASRTRKAFGLSTVAHG